MNLVFRHPRTGGELWQAGKDYANSVTHLDERRIKAVVYAASQNQPPMPDRFDVIRARLIDDPFMNERTAFLTAVCADQVSDLVVDYLRRGENVVSSCWAGWNRSGLMSALALVKLGMEPDTAIACVRNARGPSALGNPVFVRIVRALGRRPAHVRHAR
jgi:hypothetical protein